MKKSSPTIALVHDYLLSYGGAERVLQSLKSFFPDAPVHTLLYDPKTMGAYFPPETVRASFLQSSPAFFRARPRYLLPLLPIAAESFDFRDYDLVISSSSAFAKGVVTRAHTTHISYCHSPMRYAWDWFHEYHREAIPHKGLNILSRFMLHYVRLWDRAATDRVHHFIANSRAVAERIRKFYRREAEVIYPPVDVDAYHVSYADDGYFLIVSRLVAYKRIDIAIEAFNKLQLPLVIVGEGPERARLEKIAASNIRFLGWQTEEKKRELFERATAFVFSGEDDFGITAVEAMAAGKPVLAYRGGGVTESVVEGVTGEFFDEPTPEVLADGVRRLRRDITSYNPAVLRRRAEEFRKERFETALKEFLNRNAGAL